VELATLSWVHWWNTQRLLEPIGHVPPIEKEQHWLETHASSDTDRGDRLATPIT
jgi:hypothetical protein